MYLIIGLGNPDKQYENTRHNVGFMALNFLAEKIELGQFKQENKFKAEIIKNKINGVEVLMAKPQTYMNASGEAVQLIKNYYHVQTEKIIVVYDELDLMIGNIRIRSGGSSAGHNGIKSIVKHLATEKFYRIRIGIRNKLAEKIAADKFVLSKFSWLEKIKIKKDILPQATEEILKIIV